MSTDQDHEKMYNDFMDQYHQDHKVCPKCGSKRAITTLVGFVLDLRTPEKYEDLNSATCLKCGHEHTVHQRISVKQFNKIAKEFAFTQSFGDPKKECAKSFELLRRVYDLIEMSHLNDGKLIPIYTKKTEFPRSLGTDIFNFLQSKDQVFRRIFIKRQKRFRKRAKRSKNKIMNKDLMNLLGFDKELDLVKNKKCPSCGQGIDESAFDSECSRNEYTISGLCQECQDSIFGFEEPVPEGIISFDETTQELITVQEEEMSPEDAAKFLNIDLSLVVEESCFGDFKDININCDLWDRFPSKDDHNTVYFVPANVNDYIKAANIHCQTNYASGAKSDGYGGRTMDFVCTDCESYEVQGPWHTNTDSLKHHTGIDLTNCHKFYVIICEKGINTIIDDDGRLQYSYDEDSEYTKRSKAVRAIWKQHSYRFYGYNLLARFTVYGSYDDREYEVAKKAIEFGKNVYYTIQSSGGASSTGMTLELAHKIINERTEKLNKQFGI